MDKERVERNLLNENEIISEIIKIHPKQGDVLLFQMKTDENGNNFYPADEIQNLMKHISQEIFFNIGVEVVIVMIVDKIHFYSIEGQGFIEKKNFLL